MHKGKRSKALSAEIVEFAGGDEENAAAKAPSNVVTLQGTAVPETTLGAVCSSNVGIQAGASDNTLFVNDEKNVNVVYASSSPSLSPFSCFLVPLVPHLI